MKKNDESILYEHVLLNTALDSAMKKYLHIVENDSEISVYYLQN